MGVKRRAFLIGGAALVGGGIFALQYGDYAGSAMRWPNQTRQGGIVHRLAAHRRG